MAVVSSKKSDYNRQIGGPVCSNSKTACVGLNRIRNGQKPGSSPVMVAMSPSAAPKSPQKTGMAYAFPIIQQPTTYDITNDITPFTLKLSIPDPASKVVALYLNLDSIFVDDETGATTKTKISLAGGLIPDAESNINTSFSRIGKSIVQLFDPVAELKDSAYILSFPFQILAPCKVTHAGSCNLKAEIIETPVVDEEPAQLPPVDTDLEFDTDVF